MPEKIEKEDVMGLRVVRQLEDLEVVLENPYKRDPQYVNEKLPESEPPQFAVSKGRGFQVYASTSIEPNPNDYDGEPTFRGTIYGDRVGPPNYRIRVTL